MRTVTEGILLRIFLGDSDRFEGRPLYQEILAAVEAARAAVLGEPPAPAS